MFDKKKAAMIVAEFVGATILTLAVISVRSSGIGYSFFVALGAGLAMGILTLALSATSGAQLNPALTVGLWTARKVKTLAAITYVIVQLLGGWTAYGLYTYLVKTHLQATGGHYAVRILLAEALGMFVFALGWAAASAQKYDGVRRAATVGGSFAVGIMVASLASNGVINPAVAVGTHAWNVWGTMGWGTYVLGPVIGGVVGVNLYNMLMAGGSFKPVKLPVAARKKK